MPAGEGSGDYGGTKAFSNDLREVDEVLKNVRIMQTQYKKVVGILYNGEDIRVFKGEEKVKTPTKLQSVSYYLSLYTVDSIDKERIADMKNNIIGLGVDSHYAATIAYDRKGYWFNAGNKAVNWALSKERLINWGFYDLATAYQSLHVNY